MTSRDKIIVSTGVFLCVILTGAALVLLQLTRQEVKQGGRVPELQDEAEKITVKEVEMQQKEKEPMGVLATAKGFVKISSDGSVEKNVDGTTKFFTPPGLEDWSNLDPYIKSWFEFSLLEEGRVLFIDSSPALSTLSIVKDNIVYIWDVDSLEHFQPFFELQQTDQGMESFAVSPDRQRIAVITTHIDDVSIYNIKSRELLRTIKRNLVEPPLDRTGSDGVLWNETGLFVLSRNPRVTLFDPETGEILHALDAEYGWPHIFPDGSKYFGFTTDLFVREVHDIRGEIIARFDPPERITHEIESLAEVNVADYDKVFVVYRYIFSNNSISHDSKRMLLAGISLTHDKFIIWEFEPETGEIKKIGDESILPLDWVTQRNLQGTGIKFSIPEYFYDPGDENIFFILQSFGEFQGLPSDRFGVPFQEDLFLLERGEKKARFITSLPLRIFPPYSPISFLGWYKPQ